MNKRDEINHRLNSLNISHNWIANKLELKSQTITYILKDDDHFDHGMTVGFIAGLLGLLVHCFSAATFILIRIMEPFWFLAALVIAGNSVKNSEENNEEAALVE